MTTTQHEHEWEPWEVDHQYGEIGTYDIEYRCRHCGKWKR